MTTARSNRGIHGGNAVSSTDERPISSAPRVWASVRRGSGVPSAPGSAGGSCAAAGSIREAYRPSCAGASIGAQGDVRLGRPPYDACMREDAVGKTGRPTETRNKARRPRDLLGRPQPWDAENALELEDFDALTVQENHRLGREHLNAGRFFPAHEAWETAWKQSRDTTDAEFFKGLSQLGAGYVHLLRGNAHGATRLLRRASGRIRAYPSGHHGVETVRVADAADALAAGVETGRVTPGEDAVFVPPHV